MGNFSNALSNAAGVNRLGGAARNWRGVWSSISERLHRRCGASSRLALVEKISVAPRQSVALIEVDGEKLLVGLSPAESPRFFQLKAGQSRFSKEIDREIPIEGTVA